MESKKSKVVQSGNFGTECCRVTLATVMITVLKYYVSLPHPTWSIS